MTHSIRTRLRRQRQRRQNIKMALGFGTFIILLIAFVPVMLWGFAEIDCNNARNGLAFIEACEASENCTVRENELRLKEVYTRLELKSCKD